MIYRLPRWVLYGSVLLAFSAGLVNCVALLGFVNLAVSHVTGTVTATAAALWQQDHDALQLGLGIVLAFFVGAIISGVIVKNEALQIGRHYGVALLVESILLFAATYFFVQHNVWGELLASAACGLQNAMIATYSGSVIRTTHLTGILSDLGASIGNWIGRRPFNQRQFRLQLSIFSSFFLGSLVGAMAFQHLQHLALLIPAFVVLLTAFAYWWVVEYRVLQRDISDQDSA